jgi:hypothetical protein
MFLPKLTLRWRPVNSANAQLERRLLDSFQPATFLKHWVNILKIGRFFARAASFAAIWGCGICPVLGADWKALPGHVPKIISSLTAKGLLPATNQLHLAIGLPLRDAAGLDDFLAQVSDPASPNFRQYLSPEEFTARFGPTEADYAAVKQFARTNNLTITGEHGNRLLLDVSGPASAVEKAFHVTLRTYHHPHENRDFFAPDIAPTVDAQLPVADVSGLNDFSRPSPKIRRVNATAKAAPKSGSGSGGDYFGNDFRTAYVPGTTLTGGGQMVGLFEFDGFYQSDILAYENDAKLPSVPLQTKLVNGVSGVPGYSGITYGEDEVSLDIEMAVAMAPGLAKVVVFEGNLQNDILNAMAASNQVKQLSCSWSWGGGPSTTTDNIFKEMMAQGQTFFNAVGDDGAFTVGATSAAGADNTSLANAPESNPYITQVGGTQLSTDFSGAWSSESVWNDGDGFITGGGVSSFYSIPSWQTNISMTANGGSTKQRNMPDVAMVARDILVYSEAGSTSVFEGTSCATPLWASFMAMVNEQAAAAGSAPIGFANPAIYAVGKGAAYASCFNDITDGNNEWSGSPSQYVATAGYDLCTGWGTPAGTNLINALVNLGNGLRVFPTNGFNASGVKGGPFFPAPQIYSLTNIGSANISWKISHVPTWLTITPSNGTLVAFAQTNVTFNLSTAAANLAVGNYATNLWFSNVTAHVMQLRPASLQVFAAMQVTPTNGFLASGPFGGQFSENISTLVVSNASTTDLSWSLINTSSWLAVFPTNGILPAAGTPTDVTLNLSTNALKLAAKTYSATLRFTNLTTHAFQLVPAVLSVGQNTLLNGGFETGDFTGWTLVGDTSDGALIYNGVVNSTFTNQAGLHYYHSGAYGAALGERGFLATLSQPVATVPGQSYLLSFWLRNPNSASTEQFEANWNGNTIYNLLNPPVFTWTNLTFIVNATDTNSVLQFAAENDLDYFGLDDVGVTPIPAIAFQSMLRATNTYKFTWGAATGLVYQVQYKTNLLQTNWINLGKAVTAATNTLTATDTNVLLLSPQRFYRLGVTP